MRKADLVAKIAEKTGVDRVEVLQTLEEFFAQIKQNIVQGENVYVRGFGSFVAKKRARKIGRNIKKNKSIEIPEHFIPAFKPAKVFVDQVKTQLKPTPEVVSKLEQAEKAEKQAEKAEKKEKKATTTKKKTNA